MPPHQPASVNGVRGQGYAEIRKLPSGQPDCRGVIEVPSAGVLELKRAFIEDREFVFSGTVYDGSKLRPAVFPILFENLVSTSPTPTKVLLRFVSTGDPFA